MSVKRYNKHFEKAGDTYPFGGFGEFGSDTGTYLVEFTSKDKRMTKSKEELAEGIILEMEKAQELKEDCAGNLYRDLIDIHDYIRKAVNAGYKAGAPKWISVKDRLPAIGEYSLLKIEIEGEPPITYGQRWKSNIDKPWWHCMGAIYCGLESITHWMPLPLPLVTK